MTPIHPKDRPKVIALGILSTVMVGFFLMTVMGAISKKPGVQNPTPPDQTAAPAPPPIAGPAVSATVAPAVAPPHPPVDPDKVAVEKAGENPFRHVLPDPAELQRAEQARNQPAPKNNRGIPPLPPLSGRLTGGPMAGNIGGPTISPLVPPAPKIRLDGVVTDRDRYVMVTFNDRTDMYHVGARVGGLFTVTGVSQSGASFRGPKGAFSMDVGDERDATAPGLKSAPPAGAPAAQGPEQHAQTVLAPKASNAVARIERPHHDARPRDVEAYATLPLPSIEGPAAGRGH